MSNDSSEETSTFPPSANGYVLEVVGCDGKTYVLPAYWPAPFFAFVNDGERPILYHAESRGDAERFGGMLLDANFVEVRS
jgi:hypothetical protein